MPDIKLAGKLTATAAAALGEYARALYDRPGLTVMGIVELKSAKRLEVAPDEAESPVVHTRVLGLEIANEDQEDDLRRAQRALYRQRTARGTLDESDQLEIVSDTGLGLLAEMLHEREAVRMRAGLGRWLPELHRVMESPTLTPAEKLHEVDRIRDGLETLLHPGHVAETNA